MPERSGKRTYANQLTMTIGMSSIQKVQARLGFEIHEFVMMSALDLIPANYSTLLGFEELKNSCLILD